MFKVLLLIILVNITIAAVFQCVRFGSSKQRSSSSPRLGFWIDFSYNIFVNDDIAVKLQYALVHSVQGTRSINDT